MNRLIFVVGLLTVAFGFAYPLLGLSTVYTACPSTASMTLVNGVVVGGPLLSSNDAAIVWGVANGPPGSLGEGLDATYLLNVSYAQIQAGGGYSSGAPLGYFQYIGDQATYGYLDLGLRYQADGSCGSAAVSTTTGSTTSTASTTSTTSTASASSTVTTTSSTSAKTGLSTFPGGISELLVVGGIVITGVGAFLKPFKKGVL